MSEENGLIYRISGPVVTAVGISPRMYEVVRVGDEGLMGEVIELHGDQSVIQVYEETSGVRPGEQVRRPARGRRRAPGRESRAVEQCLGTASPGVA